MLRRSVEVDAFELSFAERLFRNARRCCIALAALAFTIGMLDLMNVPLLKAAGAYLRDDQQRRMALSSSQTMTQDAPPAPRNSPPLLQLASFRPGGLPALEITTASIAPIAATVHLPSPSERLHLTRPELAKAERCLATAIYFEARAEPVRGQSAVAQVIMNRVFSGYFPGDVCDVVYQSAHQRCQFSFACSPRRKVIHERGAWARASRIAARTLAGDVYDPALGASTHFHAAYLHPDWVHEMHKIVRYGSHTFYRPVAWAKSAGEAVWGTAAMEQNKTKAK